MEYFQKESIIKDVPRVLVGNKCDLEMDEELDKIYALKIYYK